MKKTEAFYFKFKSILYSHLFFSVQQLFVKREVCATCYRDIDGHNNGMCISQQRTKNANIFDINVKVVFSSLLSCLWPLIIEYKKQIESISFNHLNDIPFNVLYRKMVKNIRNEQFISLMLHVDGISICKSKKLTLWLLSGVIIELPPHLRYRRCNMILLSIYIGIGEPEPKSWLNSCFSQLNHLKNEGRNF